MTPADVATADKAREALPLLHDVVTGALAASLALGDPPEALAMAKTAADLYAATARAARLAPPAPEVAP